ncbi:MAG: M24 family metallopeptidase, partial [Promethearchaeota archaeon]
MKTARERWKLLNSIRIEKFNTSLPLAMKDNKVDMWIHSIREGNPDPLTIDLGGNKGFFVFSDLGGNRIERAVFGGDKYDLLELDCYDILGKEEELREYIANKNPSVIAINTSDWLSVADGISHSEYAKLTKLLGEKYTSKIISAENVIMDFRNRKTPREVKLYKEICEITRNLMERALSNEVIIPGKTSREDVGWWMEDQLSSRGMKGTFARTMPYVIHSDTSKRSDFWKRDYIIQHGDLIVYDFGIDFMNYGTDIK